MQIKHKPSAMLMRIPIEWLAASLFAVALVTHIMLFRLLPFPAGMLTLLLAFGVGLLACAACVAGLVRGRRASSGAAFLSVAAVFYAWQVLPTADYSIYVRFKLEQSRYEGAVRGEGCKVPGDCWSSPKLPGYIVFPYEGLGVFVAIVYAPGGDIGRFVATRDVFAGDADCDAKPISGNFFVCGMW